MRRLALAGLVVTSCSLDPDPVLDLDLTTSCNRALIVPVVEGLLADMTVYSAVVDAPDASSGWALAREAGDGAPLLAVRFPDTSVRVELAGVDPDAVELVPAPVAGEAWIAEDLPAVSRLWHLDGSLASPLVAYTSDLASFPGLPEAEWTRRLVFLGDAPHVVAIPSHSDDSDTRVWVGRLTGSLHVDVAWEMRFSVPCDDPDPDICEANKATVVYPTITWVAGPPEPRAATTTLLLRRQEARVTSGPGDLPLPEPELGKEELAVVRLGRASGGMPTGLLRTVLFNNASSPMSVAVDDFGTYVAYFNHWGGAQNLLVWWLDNADSNTVELHPPPVPPDPMAGLIQMNGDIALGAVDDGDFTILKLFTDAPSFSLSTRHDSPAGPYTGFAQAGPGHVLLHRASGAPDLVRVECDEESSSPGG